MSARGHVHVEGMRFLKDQLTDFMPRESIAILRRTVTKVAASVRNEARRNAPKDRGVLRKAIKSRREKGTRDYAEASVRVEQGKAAKYDAWYWHMVEFGTRLKAAKPFITPAFEKLRAESRSVFEREFLTQLEKQMLKRAKRQAA